MVDRLKQDVKMTKAISLVVIILLCFFIGGYIYYEIRLNQIAAENIPQNLSESDFNRVNNSFNRALWIYWTDDEEIRLEEISLFRTLAQMLTGKHGKGSDVIVSLAGRLLIEENKNDCLMGLEWQITWYAVSKWISKNWNIDECLSFLANKSYYGHGYCGLSAAVEGYFQHSAKDLSLDEISMLIAVAKSPSLLDSDNKNEVLSRTTKTIKNRLFKSKNWK